MTSASCLVRSEAVACSVECTRLGIVCVLVHRHSLRTGLSAILGLKMGEVTGESCAMSVVCALRQIASR